MIGNNIKKLRQKYELTQEELAAKLGVSRSAMGNYERETRQPDIDMLIHLISPLMSLSEEKGIAKAIIIEYNVNSRTGWMLPAAELPANPAAED